MTLLFNTILLIILFIAMFALGFIAGRKLDKSDGIFLIDDRNPDKTVWTLDYHGDPNDIPKHKKLTFRVFVERGQGS